jgi:phosphatidylserine/phosphatidylglycerophosphate/cardiolipin synthase-like enzyme
MRDQSLTVDILADELRDLLLDDEKIAEGISLIRHELPGLSDNEALKVYQLAVALNHKPPEESLEIVSTTPVSFLAKTRKTKPVIEELLVGAENNILLTAYSISDYFDDFLKLINNKSKQGVVVELFVNKYEQMRSVLSDIVHTNRRYFKVYEYSGKVDDKMAALHAKVILVDGNKMLISSANLSYHGLDGNIEIGTLITSWKKVSQVLEIFSDLKRQKVFSLIT